MLSEVFKQLDIDKIKINWNKNPIEMKTFLSFLTIKVERNYNHLGCYNGWTELYNKDINLIISGGIINNIEYLDSIKYKIKLHNPYNNFVNPFYIFDILNNDGKQFFIQYYKSDINNLIKQAKDKIEYHNNNILSLQKNIIEYSDIFNMV